MHHSLQLLVATVLAEPHLASRTRLHVIPPVEALSKPANASNESHALQVRESA